jgi:hypothetical protein
MIVSTTPRTVGELVETTVDPNLREECARCTCAQDSVNEHFAFVHDNLLYDITLRISGHLHLDNICEIVHMEPIRSGTRSSRQRENMNKTQMGSFVHFYSVHQPKNEKFNYTKNFRYTLPNRMSKNLNHRITDVLIQS